MKKRGLSILIALSILFSCLVPVGAYAATADTDIGSWEELLAFASTVNGGNSYAGKTVRLTADVAAPSGAEWSGINGFAGTFDGQGHTVSGLRMNNAAETGTGFFNTTAAGATIRDLAIADSSFIGAARTGALVGDVTGALSVSGVWVKDDVTLESSARLGGLIGNTSANVSLSNCAVDADLAITAVGGWAYGYAGGMIGWVHSGAAATITGCAYVGKLTRTGGDFFGGMVGHVYGNASRHGTVTVQTSVAAPDLSGVGGHAGGFVGGSQAASYVDLQIVNDYSGVAAIVGSGLSERILTESPNYWTPASSVNGNTRWVAFPAQLRGFALASKNYNFNGRTMLMTRDMELSFWGDWPMLGSPGRGFAGTFDGGNFAVSGLTVTTDSETDFPTGFVSLLDGTLRNLTIRASSFVNNTSFTGAAVGRVRNSAKVRNVHIASDVLVQGFQQVGGVVGKMNGTQAGCTVENCWSEANVKLAPGGMTLSCAAGGVVGMAQHPNPVIAHCLFTGTLDSSVGVGGGILGGTMDSGVKTHVKISDCVSTGTLQGDVVGTILGAFDNAQTSDDPASPSFPQTYSILNCYGVGEKVVGALTVPFGRFDDDWTENSAAYPNAEKLYGGACRWLNGAYWVFRTDGAPALKSFSTAPAYEEISDAASLLAFAAAVNGGDSYAGKTVRLTADIADVGAWSGVNGFAGTFEGGGHTVSGLTVSSDAETGAGFFNTTADGAVIRDLTIANSTFTAPARAGALVGSAAGSLTASNVRVSGDVTVTSAARLGGLVGNTEGGAVVSLENCSSQASLTVSGSTVYGYAGGLVGWVHAGASVTAAGCLYAGAVTASGGSYYGGIVGHIHGNEGSHGSVTVQSSVALPELSGAAGHKGGFVGGAQAPECVDVTLINSYSGYSSAVDASVAGRIVNDSPTYWTPAAANGTVCAVGYEAQLYGLALASKSDNFSSLTLTLSRDMDLADRGEWPVLGSADRAFAGTFDGGGHTISGLSVSLDDGSSDSTVLRAGFIGDLSGTVRDLTISESSFICAAHFAGGVAGRVMGGTVQNVRVSDTVYVQAEHQVGGIAGSLNFGGTISGCLSQARVVQTGNSYDPGGIVGTVRHTGNTVAHCLFSGALRGADDRGRAGGLVGWVPASVNVAITDCVSTGTYTGASRYGGAIGSNDGSYTITNCFVSHAARYVGSEDPGTATGSAFYPSAWQLKGTGACAGLSGEYWTLAENAVPALKAYTTVPGIAETPLMSRETLADMPAADANDVEQYTLDGMPYLGVYSRHYYYGAASAHVKYTPYLAALQEAGFVVYQGGDVRMTRSGVTYSAVLVKGGIYAVVSSWDISTNSQICIAVCPIPEDKIWDGEELFDGVNLQSWSAEAVDYGESNFVKTFKNKTQAQFETLCGGFLSGGFTLAADNGDGLFGKVFTRTYQKGDLTLTAVYTVATKEIYLTAGRDEPISPHLNDEAVWAADSTRYDSTILIRPAMTTAGSNSFIFRLKNGHFIVNDGGMPTDAENLVTTLERMAPEGEIPVVEGWFVSHSHVDHDGVLFQMFKDPFLRQRVRVDGIYFSNPNWVVFAISPESITNNVGVFRCAQMLQTSSGQPTPIYRNHIGKRYYFSDVSVDVIMAQEQLPMPEYSGDLNDSTTWIKLNIDGDTVLLGGDGDTGEMARMMKYYTSEDMTFTMRSLLHHGYNERTNFVNFCSAPTILYTCWPNHTGLSYVYSASANELLLTKSQEQIYQKEASVLVFPYTVGSYAVPTAIDEYRSGGAYTAPEAPAGKIFAGWYWDPTFDTPVEPEAVSGGAYPKFADASVLTVKIQQDLKNYSDGKRKLRIVTSVDSMDYQEVGFVLTYLTSSGASKTVTARSTTAYLTLQGYVNATTKQTYRPTVFSPESIRFCAFKLVASGNLAAKNKDGITALPYWITADGTTVYGTEATGLKFMKSSLHDETGLEAEFTLDD